MGFWRAQWVSKVHNSIRKGAQRAKVSFTCWLDVVLTNFSIERMFFKKDLILNGEWNDKNKPPYRMVNLHRHPGKRQAFFWSCSDNWLFCLVFFGDFKHVVNDCCGFCPEPLAEEDRKVQDEEDKTYVRGNFHLMTYLEDDPGRQEVGKFIVVIVFPFFF